MDEWMDGWMNVWLTEVWMNTASIHEVKTESNQNTILIKDFL